MSNVTVRNERHAFTLDLREEIGSNIFDLMTNPPTTHDETIIGILTVLSDEIRARRRASDVSGTTLSTTPGAYPSLLGLDEAVPHTVVYGESTYPSRRERGINCTVTKSDDPLPVATLSMMRSSALKLDPLRTAVVGHYPGFGDRLKAVRSGFKAGPIVKDRMPVHEGDKTQPYGKIVGAALLSWTVGEDRLRQLADYERSLDNKRA